MILTFNDSAGYDFYYISPTVTQALMIIDPSHRVYSGLYTNKKWIYAVRERFRSESSFVNWQGKVKSEKITYKEAKEIADKAGFKIAKSIEGYLEFQNK